MSVTESLHSLKDRIHKERSNVHNISASDLLELINCPGFSQKFDITSTQLANPTEVGLYRASGLEQRGAITACDGETEVDFTLSIQRDLDNVAIQVRPPYYTKDATPVSIWGTEYVPPVIRISLRDRRYDGTPGATNPYFHAQVGHMPESEIRQLPERTESLPYTYWHYSGENDKPAPGTKPLELSIASADPQYSLTHLLSKKNTLFVHPLHLLQFIDDPFSHIPSIHTTEDSVNWWWKSWFQVVDRGMRGKDIPQPGQTAQKGFSGFFLHTLRVAEDLARTNGFTHLTAVPTWTYVWHAFKERGYIPVDTNQAEETEEFLARIGTVKLMNGEPLSSLPPKHPLISWIAVAPYTLQLNSDYLPTLGIDETREKRFQDLFHNLRNAVQSEEGIKTYPLAPGRNLWLSKEL